MGQIIKCQWCGTEFERRYNNEKNCSPECAAEKNAFKQKRIHNCISCKKPLEIHQKRYCDECSAERSRYMTKKCEDCGIGIGVNTSDDLCVNCRVARRRKKQAVGKPKLSLNEVMAEAKKLNMTSGQYVAHLEIMNG